MLKEKAKLKDIESTKEKRSIATSQSIGNYNDNDEKRKKIILAKGNFNTKTDKIDQTF